MADGAAGDRARTAGRQRRLAVGLLPLANFTLVPFAGFLDTLRLAADEGDRSRPHACSWSILAPEIKPLRSSCGASLLPWETLGAPERFDYLVVAGGLLPPAGQRMLDPRTEAFLRQADHRRVGLIGLCTGAIALAEAGLLRPGGRCCVSWYHHQDLLERCAHVVAVSDCLWLREGRVLTCAGGVAAIDLAASLVAAHVGSAVAQKSLHILQMEGARAGGAPQPQPPNMVTVGDARVRRAMLLMEQALSRPPQAAALAAAVSVSKRQLERLFRQQLGVGVQTFGRDLRLSFAVWLMAQRDVLSGGRISDVAAQCGFADAAHFSRVFRRAFGAAPAAAQRGGPAALRDMLDAWWPYRAVPPGGGIGGGGIGGDGASAADRRPYL